MNGIHEVTGSIPVWSTNLLTRVFTRPPPFLVVVSAMPAVIGPAFGLIPSARGWPIDCSGPRLNTARWIGSRKDAITSGRKASTAPRL